MITETETSIVTRLLEENEEFRRLYEEHKILKEQCSQLTDHKFLTPEEELELARLKKMKLAGKDRMEQLVAEIKGNA